MGWPPLVLSHSSHSLFFNWWKLISWIMRFNAFCFLMLIFMPSPAIRCWRHSVFRLSVCDHILKVCVQDILQTTCVNFTKFRSKVQLGTKMNILDFEVKGQGHDHTSYSKNHLLKKRRYTGQRFAVEDKSSFNLQGKISCIQSFDPGTLGNFRPVCNTAPWVLWISRNASVPRAFTTVNHLYWLWTGWD